MMSGYFAWDTSNLYRSGMYSYFWASTPRSYTHSRDLYFNSTDVYPKNFNDKPFGFSLRCVAFQSSPQPSSFGYVVGHSQLALW